MDAATSVGVSQCAGLDGFGDISIFDTQVVVGDFFKGVDERSGLKKGRFMSQLMLNGNLWCLKICSDVES